MKPTKVEYRNGTLTGGPGIDFGTDGDVGDLLVHRSGEGKIISKWRASWRERLAVLFTGHVWLRVSADDTHPPVGLEGRSPWRSTR